ncbi:MAG: TonB-dependent receptor [Acidithiobacillus sp.]
MSNVKHKYIIATAVMAVLGGVGSPVAYAQATSSSGQDGHVLHHKSRKNRRQKNIYVGEVEKASKMGTKEASGVSSLPSDKHIFKSGFAQKLLTKNEIDAAGPVANAAEILSYAPGVHVMSSYGDNASTKMQININGIKQGWGQEKGDVSGHSIGITFDGVPMNDPATGLWQSPQINQASILQGVSVVYGPGNPADRWYNNIGGGINFIPLQPTVKPGVRVGLNYGSYDSKNINFSADTGLYDGFAAVIAGGASSSNSFLSAPSGSALPLPKGNNIPAYSYAWYFKGIKKFSTGDFSLGAYLAKGDSYKPYVIPINPIQGVTINGFDKKGSIPGTLYSEKTSGFYSAIPYKNDSNSTWFLYSKLNVRIATGTKLHGMVWYRHGHRQHFQLFDYDLTNKKYYEENTPSDNVYGTKVYFVTKLPYNSLKYGGYIMHSRYETINSFWNPLYGGTYENPNDKYRDNFFDQTFTAAFLQDEITPISSLSISPGFRVIGIQTNYTNNTCEKFPEACISNPKGAEGSKQAKSSSTNFEQVEPSLAINWRPIHHLALFASYSVAYQSPANGGGGGPYQSLPASSLSLEKGTEYQAGIKINIRNSKYLHRFLAGANWYFLHFANQYIPVTLASGDVINASGTSDYQGVNLFLKDRPLYWLNVFSNLSFEKAQFTNYEASGVSYNGLPVSDVPSVMFNVGAFSKYFIDNILIEPRIWMKYVGQQSIFNNLTAAPSRTKMDAYTTLNLALHATIPVHEGLLKRVMIGLTFKNILGNQYNGYEYISRGSLLGGNSEGALLGFPGAPRTVYASLSAKF